MITTLQRWLRRFTLASLCVLAQAGCATLPPPQPRASEAAFAEPQTTALGRMAAAAAPSPSISGFRVLVSGEEALGSLAALADHAQRSIDMQYYLIHSDASSRALMLHVRAAADRGVHVRLLLDDLNTAGQDAGLLRLTAHPNIDVRLFNPFPAGRLSTLSRVMASLTDVSRINQRMHNKMFVADNALAISGGRNIGDAYFVKSSNSNFLDTDLVMAGPAVRRLSATFDAFWNNPLAYPVAAVAQMPSEVNSATSDSGQATAAPPAAAPASAPVATIAPVPFANELAQGHLNLVWASAKVIADKPTKMDHAKDDPPLDGEAVADDVESLMRTAQKEVILISPYFVPGQRGVELIRQLISRGVKVRILTNSLATTDAVAVHIGYSRYRVALLQAGTELYELRPHLAAMHNLGAFGSSQASLHAKVLVIDSSVAVVGSMNMDPRSKKLNTEMGVVVRSPAIARQLAQVYEEVIADSYRVSLSDHQQLLWTTTGPHAGPPSTSEPEARWWLVLTIKLLGPLAPEEMM